MNDKFAMLQSYQALVEGMVTPESVAVLTSSRGGVACSAHPGSVTIGSFVNPQLGAGVLLGKEDLDFALPGALPVIWQRQYNSRVNPERGAACGLLGHGWYLPTEISLELESNRVLLFDATGRVVTFYQALKPGERYYSASEGIWLLRGGKDTQGYPPAWSRQQRFMYVNAELAGDEHNIFVSSGDTADVLWVFTPAPVTQDTASEVPGKASGEEDHQHSHDVNWAEHIPNMPVPGPAERWRLVMQVDRFGRSQHYQYSQGGRQDKRYVWRNGDDILPEGRLITLTDGVGRRYRLYHQRIHAGKPAQDLWGADDGWRLAGVELEHDPHYFTHDPILLARYGYDRQGQLVTVHGRAGDMAREFEWDEGRISGHCCRGGPWHRYHYGGVEPDVRVVEYANEQGLSYHLEYQSLPPAVSGKPVNVTAVTDSLGRTQTYCFEGQAGLNRLTEHHRADGTVMRYKYNGHGGLVGSIDPLERSTSMRRDMQGNVIDVQQPDKSHSVRKYDQTGRLTASYDQAGAVVRYQYDDWGRRTEVTQPDGHVDRYQYPDLEEHPFTCDCPIQIEDANGGVSQLQYNDVGQLVSYTDRLGHTTQWDYDRWGDMVEKSDPSGNTTRYERDLMGRVIATHLPNGQIRRYQYDPQGNLTRADPDENAPDSVLRINRDQSGRIVKISQGGLDLQMNWDEADRLITLINENGAQSRFVWDVMDRLVQETGFDGRVQHYQWDAAGQLIQAGEGGVPQVQVQTSQAPMCHYRWDEAGRLIERQLPATQASDGQSQRYEWDQTGRLKAACVYLITQQQEQTQERLQSRIEIERDPLGRITDEVQRLYKTENVSASSAPAVEYEHQIAHKFDPSGSQQESELQNAGQIQWLFDGLGQVQGLLHDGQNLIDFERNALYREIKRQWHLLQSAEPGDSATRALLTQTSQWDSLGRLQDTKLAGLPLQVSNPVPPAFTDQITHKQYFYDVLGQLIALQTPAQTLRYGYDAAGRLRAQADSLTPKITQHWDVDPAGNRLPGQAPTREQQQAWARGWTDSPFNPLAQNTASAQQQDTINKWPDNRIGFYRGCAWRYDAQGNRVEQVRQDADGHYSRQRLSYDGGNRLIALHVESIDAQGNVTLLSESRYIYDALGRRLKKTVRDEQQERITYYGWDGNRPVHTEQIKGNGTRDIVHTIYEPNSLTPLIRLSTTAKGALQTAKPHLMVQAMKASMPVDKRDEPGINASLAMVQNILTGIPELMQKKLEESLQQVLQSGLAGKGQEMPAGVISKVKRTNDMIAGMSKKMEENIQKITNQHGQAMQGQMLGSMMGQTGNLVANMRQGLDEMKQGEQGPVTIYYYLCNYLGMPLTLIDQQGNIVWAAKLDPWGNVQEEFNPHNIEQPIRLPGQYHDGETGLYYGIDRYYDSQIGAYINQDPVDARGEVNRYRYPFSLAPGTSFFESWGSRLFLNEILSNIVKFEEIVNFNPLRNL